MKNFTHLFLFLTFLFAAACANDEISPISGGDVQSGITAVILNPVSDDVETKALSGDLVFSWGAKDKIDVFGSESGEQMIYGVKPSAEDPKSCVLKVVSFGLVDGPYNSIYPTQGAVDDPESIPVSFTSQVQNGKNNTEHLAAFDYNAAKTEIKSNAGVFAFEHLVSWIRVHLTFTSACTVDAITLSSSSDSFVGDATIDAFAGTLTKKTSTNSLRLAFKEPISVAAGEDIWGYFTLAPTSLSNVEFTIAAENNGEVLYSDKTALTTTFTAGKYKTLNRTFGSGVAMIGSTVYESLSDAFAAVKENEIIEVLKADTYDIIGSGIANVPAGVTVKAKVNNVVFNCKGSGSAANITNGVSFDGITFEMGQTEYHGFYHSGTIAFNNCKINGYYKTYGKTIFDACTFTQTSYDYCLNAYGTDLDLINCEFNNVGKAFYVYNEGNLNPFTVNVDGCIFNVNYDGQTKAKTQIFVKNNYAKQKYTVNITGCELNVLGETDYSDKSVDPDLTNGQGDVRLWNVEEGETGPVNSTVFVNLEGVQVYPFVAPSVAKVGDTEYTTLEDAIKAALAANDGVAVELLSDITYAEGAAWTPIVFNGGTVVIDGKGYTVKGLPGMLFNKQGSGGHHLRMSNITFDGAKVSIPDSDYAAVIVGYADAMNELEFNKVSIINSSVSGKKYAAAFVGFAAGYSKRGDGPVFQEVTFADCIAENNTISGGGSTGVLMGHAAGSDWAIITVDGTSVLGNTVTSTGADNNKAGSLFGTAGNAGATPGPDGRPAGLYVTATVSANNVKSAGTTITTICGRQGSTGGRLVMTEGGSYDARPYNESDAAWASCVAGYGLSENAGIWTVVKKAEVAKIGDTSYGSIEEALAAATDGQTITIVSDFAPAVTIQVNKQITIDLAGHTIANTADLWVGNNWSIFSVKNGGNLTITGEGIIDAKENDCYAFDVCDGASLTIVNGTIIGNISAVYANKGNVTINGGAFSIKQKNSGSDPNKFLLNCLDENYKNGSASIVVKGGSFEGFNPANNAAEGAGTNFCAEGYTAVENDGVWTVKECAEVIPVSTQEELIAAIESAENGATIKLAPGAYTTYGTTYAQGKNLTFVGDGEVIWKYGKDSIVNGEGGADYSLMGFEVAFKNIIFEDNVAANNYYRGFVGAASMTFESCTLKNMMGYLGVGDVHFKDCVFDAASVCEYDIKLYSGKDFFFDGCTFYGNNKGYIQAYLQDSSNTVHMVYVKNCKFEARAATSKTAVYFYDLGANEGARWEIHFDGTNVNVNNGIANSSVSGKWLWGDMKYQESATAKIYEGSKLVWADNAKK